MAKNGLTIVYAAACESLDNAKDDLRAIKELLNDADVGASHQTGWTGLTARFLRISSTLTKEPSLPVRP